MRRRRSQWPATFLRPEGFTVARPYSMSRRPPRDMPVVVDRSRAFLLAIPATPVLALAVAHLVVPLDSPDILTDPTAEQIGVLVIVAALWIAVAWRILTTTAPLIAADDAGLWIRPTALSRHVVWLPWDIVVDVRGPARGRPGTAAWGLLRVEVDDHGDRTTRTPDEERIRSRIASVGIGLPLGRGRRAPGRVADALDELRHERRAE